ncbi:MAG: hypothetical protein O7D32_06315, partial [bacterium]|nr:hypothetical protein [bacterium]
MSGSPQPDSIPLRHPTAQMSPGAADGHARLPAPKPGFGCLQTIDADLRSAVRGVMVIVKRLLQNILLAVVLT